MMERPTLVLMAGPPGTGKTTLAGAAARMLRWPVVDKDTLKSCLLNAGVVEEIAGPASYDLMLDIGKDLLLEQRLSVILDSPAGYPSVVERARALARQADADLKFILCLADPSTRAVRLAQRTARPSQWSVDTLVEEDTRQRWISLLPPDSLVLDMAQATNDLVQTVVPYLIAHSPTFTSEGA
jgi:predicted kinase